MGNMYGLMGIYWSYMVWTYMVWTTEHHDASKMNFPIYSIFKYVYIYTLHYIYVHYVSYINIYYIQVMWCWTPGIFATGREAEGSCGKRGAHNGWWRLE